MQALTELSWPVDQARGQADALTAHSGPGRRSRSPAGPQRRALRQDPRQQPAMPALGGYRPPRGRGPPERSVADLLWTRADELPDAQAITGLPGIIVENGTWTRPRQPAWGFVRTIDYWLWGLGTGSWPILVPCQRIASALAPQAGHGSQP